MNIQPDQRSPYAVAMEWVAKITSVAIEMFLPAVGGHYLDRWAGTNFWAILGLVFGVTVGIWHLVRMTKVPGKNGKSQRGTPGQ